MSCAYCETRGARHVSPQTRVHVYQVGVDGLRVCLRNGIERMKRMSTKKNIVSFHLVEVRRN